MGTLHQRLETLQSMATQSIMCSIILARSSITRVVLLYRLLLCQTPTVSVR